MTTPRISRYRFDNESRRWLDTRSGRVVPAAAIEDEMRQHQEATFEVLDNATEQLYEGRLNIPQWQVVIALELKAAHLAQSMFAVGGKANLTPVNYGRVGGVLADEYRFLNQFAQDIGAGQVSRAQALARVKQYGRATQQAFWREFAQATPDTEVIYWELNIAEHCSDCIDLATNSPYTAETIPTFPGAGETECRGNCKCNLRRGA